MLQTAWETANSNLSRSVGTAPEPSSTITAYNFYGKITIGMGNKYINIHVYHLPIAIKAIKGDDFPYENHRFPGFGRTGPHDGPVPWRAMVHSLQ